MNRVLHFFLYGCLRKSVLSPLKIKIFQRREKEIGRFFRDTCTEKNVTLCIARGPVSVIGTSFVWEWGCLCILLLCDVFMLKDISGVLHKGSVQQSRLILFL